MGTSLCLLTARAARIDRFVFITIFILVVGSAATQLGRQATQARAAQSHIRPAGCL